MLHLLHVLVSHSPGKPVKESRCVSPPAAGVMAAGQLVVLIWVSAPS